MPEHSGLHEYIDMMEKWKERTYLVGYSGYRKQPWTFEKVRAAILGLSRALEERGIGKGDRVILNGKACPEWVVAFFAILHRGAIVVPVDPNSSKELISKIYEKASPALTLCDDFPDNVAEKIISLSSVKGFYDLPPGHAEKITQNDMAEIVFTSGTTAEPKGVMLTHGNILSTLKPIDNGLEDRQKLVKLLTPFRILCTVPYSHMFGQVAGIFLPILIGSTIYYTEDTGPASLVRAIRRNRIFTLITVPRVMKLLKDHIKSDLNARGKIKAFERRWERWVKLPYPVRVFFFLNIHRFLGLHFWSFIVGGAPLDPDTHEFWRRLVFSVWQGYGLTESAPIVTLFNPFKDKRDSVGRVFPGQEVKVLPDGEILVKGENVMAGYFGDPKGTAKVIDDGWLRTGDIGTMDEEGLVFIRGRKKDMILTSNGHNVFSDDVNYVLNKINGVREGFVFGMPGPAGESVHAVLLLDRGANPDEIIKKANSKLQSFQKIRGYSVWNEADFPRTPTLKVRKAEVISKISSIQKRAPKRESILGDLVAGEVHPEAKLVEDLGLDSLDRIEAVSRIEKRYGISLDESIIGPDTTVRELEELAQHPRPMPALPMPKWAKWKPVRFMRRIVMDGFILQVMRFYSPLKSYGLKNLEKLDGPRIFAANHTSHLDPFAVLLTLPARWRKLIAPAMGLNRFWAYFREFSTVAKKKDSSIRRFLHGLSYRIITFLFQTYPFPQGSAYRPSLEYTGELLDDGFWILIFPEGEVTPNGKIHPFRKGISIIAERTAVPVFPVFIKGMEDVLPLGKKWPRRRKVTITFGEPLSYKGEGYESFALDIENAVKKLMTAKKEK